MREKQVVMLRVFLKAMIKSVVVLDNSSSVIVEVSRGTWRHFKLSDQLWYLYSSVDLRAFQLVPFGGSGCFGVQA